MQIKLKTKVGYWKSTSVIYQMEKNALVPKRSIGGEASARAQNGFVSIFLRILSYVGIGRVIVKYTGPGESRGTEV